MRSISTLFLFILILYSCEEVIQVDVVNTTPRISIDGHFNLFTQETPVRLDGGVRLTKSSDYFDLSVPLITDATVTITHLESRITYPLIYRPDTTFYIPENPLILTDFNSDYLLRIFYKGEIFESKTSFIPVAPFKVLYKEQRPSVIKMKRKLSSHLKIMHLGTITIFLISD